jgi:2-methylisocitrate lyase-like PEP mutase family enzyme
VLAAAGLLAVSQRGQGSDDAKERTAVVPERTRYDHRRRLFGFARRFVETRHRFRDRSVGGPGRVGRIAAAAEAAHATVGAAESLVLTARAENFLRGNPDLADTISRAQAFQEAGADVVYAPGLVAIGDIEQLVSSVDVPVNVLIWPAGPTIEELASAGVARVSVGGGFSLLSFGAVARAAKDLLVDGTHGFWDLAAEGRAAREKAFG